MRKLAFWGVLAILLGSVPALASVETVPPGARMKLKNDFKSPEEVVRYYVSRDSGGFYFAPGMDRVEMEAFTSWKRPPQGDDMAIASRVFINPAKVSGDEATVEVIYRMKLTRSAQGGEMNPESRMRTVNFGLKKQDGIWKIVSPAPDELYPVVQE